ncbi:MAG: acylphosphatase [Anaerosomatales bacterium]|nr:acylphosphatase [Anaerosomatales bacterium]MDT8433680.1 acylphosphatase [Anaerosomatales bacterium]
MTAATLRRHVWVDGVVQGVFFRAATAEMADGLGLAGWVRNLADGRVEAVFEGPPESVDAAVAWCRRGPRRAVVERVEVAEEAAEGARGFRVIA